MISPLVSGCSSSAGSVSSAYISPLTYHSLDCNQISLELQRVSNKMQEVSGHQDAEAGKDAVAMGAGLLLFWPALFFLGGGGDREHELARLKGEYDALAQAAITKNCTTVIAQMDAAREAAEAAKAKAKEDDEDCRVNCAGW